MYKYSSFVFCLIVFFTFGITNAIDFQVEIEPGKDYIHPLDMNIYYRPNTDLYLDIKMGNNDGINFIGYSQTHQFYSTNGDGTIINWIDAGGMPVGSIVRMNGWEDATYWNLLNRIAGFSWDGVLPDTMNHSVASKTSWPAGDPTMTRLRFHFNVPVMGAGVPDDVVEICVDQSEGSEPPYDWIFPITVDFEGPYCFKFVEAPNVRPEIVDLPIILTTEHDLPYYEELEIFDAEGDPSTDVRAIDENDNPIGTVMFSSGTGSFVWEYDPWCLWVNDGFAHTVRFYAEDNVSGHVYPDVNISNEILLIVTNSTPVISDDICDRIAYFAEGETRYYDFYADDPNLGDIAIWLVSADPEPEGLYDIDVDGRFEFTPTSNDNGILYTFTVRVTDCADAYNECSFSAFTSTTPPTSYSIDFWQNHTCGVEPLEVEFSGAIDPPDYPEPIEWFWDFGDDNTSIEQNPIHTYTAGGVYDVQLKVFAGGIFKSLLTQDLIYVGTQMDADFMINEIDGSSVGFCPYIGCPTGAEYLWDFGDGETSTECSPIHEYTMNGTYDVSLDVTLNFDNCNFSDTEIKYDCVEVCDLQAQFTAPMQIFMGQPAQFSDGSDGQIETWYWEFGDMGTSIEQNPIHTYTQTGTYEVLLRIGAGGCEREFIRQIQVVETPIVDLEILILGPTPKPGFPCELDIYYTNTGTETLENTEMWVSLDPLIEFYSFELVSQQTGTYSGYSLDANIITVPIGTVDPTSRYGGAFKFTGLLSQSALVGGLLHIEYGYTSDQGSGAGYIDREIPGSIDPNDKLAFPGGKELTGNIAPDQRIEYLIQFENKPIATAEATYVLVIDTLDVKLDWNSLAFGSVSHPSSLATMDFDPFTGILTWFFDDIQLPPNQNPPEGEGYVLYSIAPKANLPYGTEISNSAYIKFDYNAWLHAPEAGVPIVRTIVYDNCDCGDVNCDNKVNILDIVFLLNYKYKDGSAPAFLESADVNSHEQPDGMINILDIVYLINYKYKNGPVPVCQ